MNMVMLAGFVLVCWVPDRQVVPLCTGGLDKSKEISVASMGGKNPHVLLSSHFFNANTSIEEISMMMVINLLVAVWSLIRLFF